MAHNDDNKNYDELEDKKDNYDENDKFFDDYLFNKKDDTTDDNKKEENKDNNFENYLLDEEIENETNENEESEISEDEKNKNKTQESKQQKEVNEEDNFFGKLFELDDKEFENYIMNKNKKRKRNSRLFSTTPFLVFIIIMSYFIYSRLSNEDLNSQKVSYTQFIEMIDKKEISEIREKDSYLYADGISKGEKVKYSTKKITERVGDDQNLIQKINENDIKLISLDGSNKGVFLSILFNFLPIMMLIGFYLYMSSKMSKGDGGMGGGLFNIGNVGTKVSEIPNVRFKDVAGVDDAKEELREVVEFLKTPDKFIKAGARIPKGILLEGDPGTGKTLLAKAVAGESGSAFYIMSGSEFVEMYVGVGASRVRKLFKEAKKNKPAIVFIDEIDAVGRARGSDRGGNDEREQTLNQLLVEMDGFSDKENIIVIAATNRADVLDKALTRSGRFDRKVRVNLPDMQARIDILNVHARNKKFTKDVKLEDIAKITPGFSGADLENILNEAAILAAREEKVEISMSHLDEAVDKMGMGLGQKNKKISDYEKKLTAYHEGGHALISSLLENADKVHKVTIIPRGDAGGYMMPLPEEKNFKSKKAMYADIMVAFGGRVAEELILDDISTGAYSDIRSATYTANVIVRSVGMNDKIGPVNLEDSQESFKNIVSEETNREVELQVRELLKKLYDETVELMRNNIEKLENIAELLLKKETITGMEVRALVNGNKTVDEVLNMSKKDLEMYY